MRHSSFGSIAASGVGLLVPVNSVLPTFYQQTSAIRNGDILQVDSYGIWDYDPQEFTVHWYYTNRDRSNWSLVATGTSYEVTNAVIGYYLYVGVIATNAVGDSVEVYTSESTYTVEQMPAPENLSAPSIQGMSYTSPISGDYLSADPGTWSGSPTFTYTWVLNGVPFSNEVSGVLMHPSYIGNSLYLSVSGTNAGGSTGPINTATLTVLSEIPASYPAYGTPLGDAYCDGINLLQDYADGNGGSFSGVNTYNSVSCGGSGNPSAGTLIGDPYCTGYDQYQDYADGSGGTYSSLIGANSTTCGYICPASGTPIGDPWCNGYDLVQNYADGMCGTYPTLLEANSATCGFSYPAYGTPLEAPYCDGYDLVQNQANGSGGSFIALIEANSVTCGYTP